MGARGREARHRVWVEALLKFALITGDEHLVWMFLLAAKTSVAPPRLERHKPSSAEDAIRSRCPGRQCGDSYCKWRESPQQQTLSPCPHEANGNERRAAWQKVYCIQGDALAGDGRSITRRWKRGPEARWAVCGQCLGLYNKRPATTSMNGALIGMTLATTAIAGDESAGAD